MITGTLKMAAQAVDGRLVGANESFAALATDTRTLHAGELFVALKGGKFDGHRFIEDALGAGASGAVVDQQDRCGLSQYGGQHFLYGCLAIGTGHPDNR